MIQNFKLETQSPNHLYRDVVGAPYKIGQEVRVTFLCDETADPSFLWMDGVVEHLDYDCGCGQSYPGDPMIGVRFADGRIEELWREELEVLKEPADRHRIRPSSRRKKTLRRRKAN